MVTMAQSAANWRNMHTQKTPWSVDWVYVGLPCIYRIRPTGGVIVGDSGHCCYVPVQCVTPIVRAQLLRIVCWFYRSALGHILFEITLFFQFCIESDEALMLFRTCVLLPFRNRSKMVSTWIVPSKKEICCHRVFYVQNALWTVFIANNLSYW